MAAEIQQISAEFSSPTLFRALGPPTDVQLRLAEERRLPVSLAGILCGSIRPESAPFD